MRAASLEHSDTLMEQCRFAKAKTDAIDEACMGKFME
jgi:hypothetical protein